MLSDDLNVIDSMWVGYILTEPDFHALQRIKNALVEAQATSTNRPIMPVCPHAKVKWVVCDCDIKGELAYDYLDCNGEGTYSVPGNNGFGYSRQCGKVAPGKPA